RPLAGTLAEGAITVRFGDTALPARLHVSRDRRVVTLFYQRHLPDAAVVTVRVDGGLLLGADGLPVDANADGVPGGVGEFAFTTVPMASVGDTAVTGRVFASELLAPEGTRKVSVNRPLGGVRLYVEGAEDRIFSVTDSQGNFRMEHVPAGEFFVYIDGRTVTTTPDGVSTAIPSGPYYPFVGKKWFANPGGETNVGEIYLPLVVAGTMQVVSESETTTVGFPQSVLDQHPDFEGVRLLVPPGALYSDDGLRGGRVGIAPVPPDRIPSPLPDGLNLPIVITVQTDGPTNFDEAVPVCFPNVGTVDALGQTTALPPGTRSALWSFDHDVGDWDIVGTMTVSEDGSLICSDAGFGIREPGWHGSVPAGKNKKKNPGNKKPKDPGKPGPAPPPPPPDCNDEAATQPDKLTDQIDELLGIAARDCLQGLRDARHVVNCRRRVNETLNRIAAYYHDEEEKLVANESATGQDFRDLAGSLESLLASHFNAAQNCGTTDQFLNGVNQFRQTAACLDATAAAAEEPCSKLESQGGPCKPPESVTDTCNSLRNRARNRAENLRKLADRAEAAHRRALSERETLSAMIADLQDTASGYKFGKGGAPLTPEQRAEITTLSSAIVTQMLVLYNLGVEEGLILDENAAVFGDLGEAQASMNAALATYFPEATSDTRYFLLETNEAQRRFVYPGPEASLFLPGGEAYFLSWFDPRTREVGFASGRTTAVGQEDFLESGTARRDDTPDSDNDGLSDAAEFIIGTLSDSPDSDGDGVLDGAEITQGSNPLDGFPIATGIVGAAAMEGEALDVATLNNIAAVANGEAGVTFLNVFNPFQPVRVGQMDTPGKATRVALSDVRCAVADDRGGLHLIDISDPPNAAIVRTYPPSALGGVPRAVAFAGDLLYVGTTNGDVHTIDSTGGLMLSTTRVVSPVLDIAIVRDSVAVLDSGSRVILYVTGASFGTYLSRVTNVSTTAGSRLFATDGLLYATSITGYTVLDVGSPTSPANLGEVRLSQVGLRQLVLNNGDEGIAAVATASDATGDVEFFGTQTAPVAHQFRTTYDTPGDAVSVAIYGGVAFAAAADAGLQIINYRGFDTGGVAPTVTVTTSFEGNPATVEEGQLVRLTAQVSDDVQVRSVEWYRDGERVLIDGSFPFEWRFRLPRLGEASSISLRARVFDTGGNSTWSDTITVNLSPDATPPFVAEVLPTPLSFATGAEVRVFFSEPMNPESLAGSFRLRSAGADRSFFTADDTTIDVTNATFGPDGTFLYWVPATPLSPGLYRAEISAPLADLAGYMLQPLRQWDFIVYAAGIDGDSDCIPDELEPRLGLLPTVADSDSNGILDGNEDSDFDGVPNCQELVLGFDPALPDTDGDGVQDGLEDRDRDALPDVQELVRSAGLTTPDTDGDGFLDGEEVLAETDPLSAASKPALVADWPQSAVSPIWSLHNAALDPPTIPYSAGPTFAVENNP
ncbi:hypothetical protein GC173_07610, partial [bacterium]|nr:hypothetical protein [bacterium]